MTDRQKLFCDYYILEQNATAAAIKAGYSKKTAKVIGYENLTKPYLKAYIDERLAAAIEKKEEESGKRIASIGDVMQFFTDVMKGEVKDQFDLDAALTERLTAGKELIRRYQFTEKSQKDEDEIKDALEKMDEALKRFGGVV